MENITFEKFRICSLCHFRTIFCFRFFKIVKTRFWKRNFFFYTKHQNEEKVILGIFNTKLVKIEKHGKRLFRNSSISNPNSFDDSISSPFFQSIIPSSSNPSFPLDAGFSLLDAHEGDALTPTWGEEWKGNKNGNFRLAILSSHLLTSINPLDAVSSGISNLRAAPLPWLHRRIWKVHWL